MSDEEAESQSAQPTTLATADVSQMSKVERLKVESEGLFFVAGREKHPFAAELDALTRGEAQTISNDAKEISKYFGIYKQQERSATGSKTGDYIFMLRLKNPAGGELSPEQWQALDDAADRFANGTLRLTTRQGVQYHYVYGRNLGPLVRHLHQSYADRGYQMTSLGACGDVNRNTMCSPVDDLHAELPLRSRELAHAIARELAPVAGAQSYYQIFLSDDEGRQVAPMTREEPIYGKHYLPRKFKIGIAHPHDNSIDMLTQDIGYLPVVNGALAEQYDLYAGGGLGVTHNQPDTQALLGLYLGRIPAAQVVESAKAIAILQKEHGERKNRRQARWKYTIRRLGVERVKRELRERFGIELKDAAPQPIPPILFWHGWHRQAGEPERWFLGVPVENGRLADRGERRLRSAVRRIVSELGLGVRITPGQDLLLCHVPAAKRAWVDGVLAQHGVPPLGGLSPIRRSSFACPAKPTCGLAMTDAENVLPHYMDAIEAAGLGGLDVQIRMAGCPNGCSRPPTAEIGIYGYGKNDHVVTVGGSREGTRIGRVLYERVPEESMTLVLIGLLRAVRDHNPGRLPPGEYLWETPLEELRRLAPRETFDKGLGI
jgi:sulfite reductase (ferredoxin)